MNDHGGKSTGNQDDWNSPGHPSWLSSKMKHRIQKVPMVEGTRLKGKLPKKSEANCEKLEKYGRKERDEN